MFDTLAAWLRRVRPGTIVRIVLVLILTAVPLYLDNSLLQTGLFSMAAVVGAIGLTILTGTAGQLSLAHAFFLAVGAYSYSYFAGIPDPSKASKAHGLGLPPLLAMVLAVATSGLVGLLFSPIASRLRGIYLGVASLSLVFIGSFLYENARSLTGGFNGRPATDFSLFGFHFAADTPPLTVLNVPYGRYERLWYLFLVLTILAYVFGANVLRGRMGRAMQTMRDNEVAAATMGVDIRRTKAGVFGLSSMYAGLAGVMVALAFTRVTPEYFILPLSISYLAMIVIGGLGSIGGAALGAVFVTALPTLLSRYSDSLPFVAQSGSGGYDAGKLSAALYGLAIVLVVMFEPGGLSALGKRLTIPRHRHNTSGPAAEPKRTMPRSGSTTRTQEDPV